MVLSDNLSFTWDSIISSLIEKGMGGYKIFSDISTNDTLRSEIQKDSYLNVIDRIYIIYLKNDWIGKTYIISYNDYSIA